MEPSPSTEPPPQAPAPPASSLWARLANVFVTPAEVFDEVKHGPSRLAHWLLPALLMSVIGIVSVCVVLSQPAILQRLREQQQQAIDKKVAAGQMTQAQADKAMELLEKFSSPAVMKMTGSIAAVAGSFTAVFWWALLLWLLGKFFLKANLDFLKMAEVAGLASMILLLEAVLKTLLIVLLADPSATLSLAMLVKTGGPGTPLALVLGVLDPITFWALAVRSLGLARLAGVPWSRAAAGVFGVWIVLTGIFIGLAVAAQAAVPK